MLALILILIIIFIAAGIVGFVVKGLFYLFVIAAILFVITVLCSFFSAGLRHSGKKITGPDNAKHEKKPDNC